MSKKVQINIIQTLQFTFRKYKKFNNSCPFLKTKTLSLYIFYYNISVYLLFNGFDKTP